MLGLLDSGTICDPRSSYWCKDAAMTALLAMTETPTNGGQAWLRLRSVRIRSAGRTGSKLPEWDRAPYEPGSSGGVMTFLVGLVLFAGLCGSLDTWLPRPSLRRKQR